MGKGALAGRILVAAIGVSQLAQARFLSVDPKGPKPGNIFSFNRYPYANNNPVVNIDPDGRYACGSTDNRPPRFPRPSGNKTPGAAQTVLQRRSVHPLSPTRGNTSWITLYAPGALPKDVNQRVQEAAATSTDAFCKANGC